MKNALYIGCGDARLWKTHTALRNSIVSQRESDDVVKLYNLLIPGPDKGAQGDDSHFAAQVQFVKQFYDLTNFSELHIQAHTDCAGCQATDEEHRQLVKRQAEKLAEELEFTGEVFVYLAVKSEEGEYGVWKIETLAELDLRRTAA